MSKSAGYKLWRDMLKEPAESLNLDIDKEHDLLSVANIIVMLTRGWLLINSLGKIIIERI